MENLLIKNMYDLNETIAADLFEGLDYPWQALPKIGDFIKLFKKAYGKVLFSCFAKKQGEVYLFDLFYFALSE